MVPDHSLGNVRDPGSFFSHQFGCQQNPSKKSRVSSDSNKKVTIFSALPGLEGIESYPNMRRMYGIFSYGLNSWDQCRYIFHTWSKWDMFVANQKKQPSQAIFWRYIYIPVVCFQWMLNATFWENVATSICLVILKWIMLGILILFGPNLEANLKHIICIVWLGTYLEDHPRTCKWLVTMVSKSPKWGYGTPYKWPKWLINGGY